MPPSTLHLIDEVFLARLLDATLKRVDYWCLKHEADPEDIAHPQFFLGGAVKLTLNDQSLFITWTKEIHRPLASSLTVQSTCTWQPDYYIEIDASGTPYWGPLIGRRLVQADLMGWRSAASIVALSFENQVMYIGTGRRLDYGYGDDILIRSQETFWLSPHEQNLEILQSFRQHALEGEMPIG